MCLVSSDSLRGISLQEMRTYGVLFFFVVLFFTHCAINLLPLLTVVDNGIGLRLGALKHDYFLVLRS